MPSPGAVLPTWLPQRAMARRVGARDPHHVLGQGRRVGAGGKQRGTFLEEGFGIESASLHQDAGAFNTALQFARLARLDRIPARPDAFDPSAWDERGLPK